LEIVNYAEYSKHSNAVEKELNKKLEKTFERLNDLNSAYSVIVN
jgi:hypothetical protein